MSDNEELCDDGSYTLEIKLSLKPVSGGEAFSEIEYATTIPFLLDDDHLLIAEPRVKKAVDSAIEPFTLKTAVKLNRLIEEKKNSHGQEDVLPQDAEEETVVEIDDESDE